MLLGYRKLAVAIFSVNSKMVKINTFCGKNSYFVIFLFIYFIKYEKFAEEILFSTEMDILGHNLS